VYRREALQPQTKEVARRAAQQDDAADKDAPAMHCAPDAIEKTALQDLALITPLQPALVEAGESVVGEKRRSGVDLVPTAVSDRTGCMRIAMEDAPDADCAEFMRYWNSSGAASRAATKMKLRDRKVRVPIATNNPPRASLSTSAAHVSPKFAFCRSKDCQKADWQLGHTQMCNILRGVG